MERLALCSLGRPEVKVLLKWAENAVVAGRPLETVEAGEIKVSVRDGRVVLGSKED
jgi:hypothetical protein